MARSDSVNTGLKQASLIMVERSVGNDEGLIDYSSYRNAGLLILSPFVTLFATVRSSYNT